MELWSTNVSYENYFNHCAVDSCVYSYIDHANLLYTLTTLLGLYGRLQVVLYWWSAQFMTFIYWIRICYQQRTPIHPIV